MLVAMAVRALCPESCGGGFATNDRVDSNV